ncbi:C-factor [Cristinia sonorae]|uniref:C-factor n=1 Tax=Cristinia sonorae TaxID=1940300 RepID=A0A8K0UP84_9AGAR|nr:C-factor [Cristinia sonorae]
MTSTRTWLITGSSRGIGLEFVRQLSASPENVVIATCRTPDTAQDLKAIASNAKGNVHIIPLDTSDSSSITAVEKPVKDIIGNGPLDYILNNAAINPGNDTAFEFALEDFIRTMTTNVAGPAQLTQLLLPYLERSSRPVVMNMSTGLASIGIDAGPKCNVYSASKTALNMLTYKQSKAKPNIIFYVVDPGWVKTEMGGDGAYLEPEFTVSNQLKLLHSITLEQSGKFFRYDGSILPW